MKRHRNAPSLSKLNRPRLYGAVERERLFRRLDGSGERHGGLCVVGPPGAGKTTLVASWLESRGRGGIWYQVDAGDADLATFFHYLGRAAEGYTRKGQRPLPALTPEYLADVPGFSRRFFRTLFERLPAGSALVLDNYQEVDADNPLHELIVAAVDEVPSGSHLIVVSRADPPSCYARLKANRSVSTIEWTELRLTLEEAQAIGAQQPGVDPERVPALYEQCEGWAAGLILMLTSQSATNGGTMPAVGDREAVFEYFAGTLFDRAPEQLREVLLSVAFVPYVRPEWAIELSGDAEAGKHLEVLYRRHFFTQRRMEGDGSYQFHALFQSFLRDQARRTLTEACYEEVLGRSAHLLREAGEIEGAFELDCTRSRWGPAADLLLGNAETMIATGRWQTLVQAVDRLPGVQLTERPRLAYWLGVALTPIDYDKAFGVLQRAFEAFEGKGDIEGQAASVAGILNVMSVWYQLERSRVQPWIDVLIDLVGRIDRYESPESEMRILTSLLDPGVMVDTHDLPFTEIIDRVRHLVDMTGHADLKLRAVSALLSCAIRNLGDYGHYANAAINRVRSTTDWDKTSPAISARFFG
ncbi:MAG: hypothetical protein AB7F99_20450, partial [Vicinamibacterales bacterium]